MFAQHARFHGIKGNYYMPCLHVEGRLALHACSHWEKDTHNMPCLLMELGPAPHRSCLRCLGGQVLLVLVYLLMTSSHYKPCLHGNDEQTLHALFPWEQRVGKHYMPC